ncbi:MAG: hypothetical protein ACREXT_11590 [Gammaproteobacteria bacterium]
MTTGMPPFPRAVAIFLPPIAALALAALYMQMQSKQAQQAADGLCAQFKAGDSVAAFEKAARDTGFEIDGLGRNALLISATKIVYRINRESYRCSATHDGEKILTLKTSVATD